MPRKHKRPWVFLSGFCNPSFAADDPSHGRCRGAYEGNPCVCPCHLEPDVLVDAPDDFNYQDAYEWKRIRVNLTDENGPVSGVHDIPAEDYHAHPALSSTGARKLLPPSCPARFKYERDHGQPHKDEFDFGHAAHLKILGAGPELAVIEADDWKTKAAREAREEAYAEGKVPLLPKDLEVVEAMAAALREHPTASALLDPDHGKPEQSLFWRDSVTGISRRARLDWLPEPGDGRLILPDYKTTPAADKDAVERSIAKFGYYMQADYYLDGARSLGLADDDAVFVFIFQERTPPYLVSVYQPDAMALRIGAARNRRAIEIYQQCMETDVWPGYSDRVEVALLPPYIEKHFIEEYAL